MLLGSACCRYPQLGGLRSVSIVLLTVCVSCLPFVCPTTHALIARKYVL